MDSLRRRVLARDRLHNTDRQIEVTTRGLETRQICIDCRRAHHPYEHYVAWFTRMQALPPEERTPYAPQSPCRDCGGQLVSITW
jgi:hypothetical protein